jgi:putative ABC transport system ATP-binding protein
VVLRPIARLISLVDQDFRVDQRASLSSGQRSYVRVWKAISARFPAFEKQHQIRGPGPQTRSNRISALCQTWLKIVRTGLPSEPAKVKNEVVDGGAAGSAVDPDTLDQNLFRFVWRHSRRDQIFVLVLILLSLPFYWGSLDIPKRIVNDGLQGKVFQGVGPTVPFGSLSITLPQTFGGATLSLFPPWQLDQQSLLFALSGLYLFFVLVNGGFKYVINVRKGVLAERVLRRLRYVLLAQFLRFKPEEARTVKPAELASMIKDEVEPIGGFIGDAFIQPVFLGTQALTALLFIMVQNTWLGLLVLSILVVQSVIIPRLRREQIRLGRERQIASRALAGRLGEIVEGAPAIHAHGTDAYSKAEVGTRLGGLFWIRVELYSKKFAVKFLNNLLAQLTPFLLFTVGGYFALTGSLDLGQLVAVIVAYRDLPPPIKELIDWDQQRTDVIVKYQQITSQFPVDRQLAEPEAVSMVDIGPLSSIEVDKLQIADRLGVVVLDGMTARFDVPTHVALVGPVGGARSAFAQALGRHIMDYKGAIRLNDRPLNTVSRLAASRSVAYAGAHPDLFQGSLRENIIFSLHRALPVRKPEHVSSKDMRKVLGEAHLSGNLIIAPGDDWIDYAAAGASSAEELDDRCIEIVRAVGLENDVYRFGLLGRLKAKSAAQFAAPLVEARQIIQRRLEDAGLGRFVAPFDPSAYNTQSSIKENILFGAIVGTQFSNGAGQDRYLRAVLSEEALLEPLLEVGQSIAETTIEMFGGLPAGHPLFERFSFISSEDMADYKALLAQIQAKGMRDKLSAEDEGRLLGLAFAYVEPRHRLNLLDEVLRDRILAARHRFRNSLPASHQGAIEFYDPASFLMSATIRDNLLFGRLAFDLPDAEQKVWGTLRQALRETGLDRTILQLGLDYDVGPGGKLLDARQRCAVDLARCMIRRPDLLIVDGALTMFEPAAAREALLQVRGVMKGKTLIVGFSDPAEAAGFDRVLTFSGTRLSS